MHLIPENILLTKEACRTTMRTVSACTVQPTVGIFSRACLRRSNPLLKVSGLADSSWKWDQTVYILYVGRLGKSDL